MIMPCMTIMFCMKIMPHMKIITYVMIMPYVMDHATYKDDATYGGHMIMPHATCRVVCHLRPYPAHNLPSPKCVLEKDMTTLPRNKCMVPQPYDLGCLQQGVHQSALDPALESALA